MTYFSATRATALAAMLAGAACTETIHLNVQELAIPGPDGPGPGMGRIAITRVPHPRNHYGLDLFNVLLDGSYLVHHRKHLVRVGPIIASVIDVPVGKHTIELEYAFDPSLTEWVHTDLLGSPHGETAVTIAVTVGERTYNEVVVHGPNGDEKIRVFLDELRGVPEGSYRARVMNVLDVPLDLHVLACPTSDSCTTIKSDLAWGEMWEGLVDVAIVAAVLPAGATQPAPLFTFPDDPLPPRVTPAFVSLYGFYAWPYASPDPLCPDGCNQASVAASYSPSPFYTPP
jgi:hypothetical protein